MSHVATLRQLRKGKEPNPVFAALICQSCGADSIVVHLREDRRHINEEDLFFVEESGKDKIKFRDVGGSRHR